MTKMIRKIALVTAFVVSCAGVSTPSYAFSPEAQQMCTGDAFSTLQLGNSRHSADHGLHDEKPRES